MTAPAAPLLAVGFDTETHRVAPGRLVPRLVCLSLAGDGYAPKVVHEAAAGGAHGTARILPGGRSWSAVLDRDAVLRSGVLDWLFGPTVCAVGHNTAYDLAVLLRAVPAAAPAIFRAVAEGRVVDTLIREKLLCVATGELDFRHGSDGSATKTDLSLAGLEARYLGLDRSADKTAPDAWRLRYQELDGVPIADWPADAVRYAAEDASGTLAVAREQGLARATVGGYTVIEDGGALGSSAAASLGRRVVSEGREVCAALALHLQAAWGLRVDPERTTATLAAWHAHAAAGREAAARRGWVRVAGRDKGKPGSLNKKALQGAVGRAMERGQVDHGKWMTRPTKTFPLGQVKTSEEVVAEAADHASPDPEGDDLRSYAESIEYTGHLSRWGPALAGAGRYALTSSPVSLRETGRTAWRNPPLQQPPRKGGMRECVAARPGWVLCSVDYDAGEFVAMGQLCVWAGLGSTIADAMNAGMDPHAITGAAIRTGDGTPTTYEALRALVKAGDASAVTARQVGKHANFGFLGGMGPPGFVALVREISGGELALSLERAVAIREVFFQTWPEVRAYLAWVQAVVGDGGVVRHPVSGRVRGGARMTAAFNGYFQGLVADGAKYAAWLLAHAAYTGTLPDEVVDAVRRGDGARCGTDVVGLADAAAAFAGSRPVLFLHDEVIAELPGPPAAASRAADAMALLMRWAMQRHMPDVLVGCEPALMARWCKGAKAVRDPLGFLVPWEPPADAPAPSP